MTTTRPAPLADHVATFPANGTTDCTCGRFSGKTYVGWKRHYKAEKRKLETAAAESTEISIPGREIEDGDVVYVTGRWQVLTNIRPADSHHFTADTADGGHLLANVNSDYDVRR
jgi:hypothetical protein